MGSSPIRSIGKESFVRMTLFFGVTLNKCLTLVQERFERVSGTCSGFKIAGNVVDSHYTNIEKYDTLE